MLDKIIKTVLDGKANNDRINYIQTVESMIQDLNQVA